MDGSGAIDVDELLHAMSLIGLKAPRAELLELINTVDVNRSGEMEFPEFLELMSMHILVADGACRAMLTADADSTSHPQKARCGTELSSSEATARASPSYGFTIDLKEL